ncbi:MAG: hypothetical protein Q4G25_10515 [Paracoccus sp. (in: a-proteobacteria)]|nr:hypothetical protein [Paracoccus sp. (in: a-proteobacteria)]
MPALSRLSFVAALLLPVAGLAQGITITRQVSLDLIPGRAGLETAELVRRPASDEYSNSADLIIRGADGTEIARAERIGLYHAMQGFTELSVAPNGSSLIVSEVLTGVGRGAHAADFTIAYRNGGVVVAGFTRSSWDRITNETLSCDWNLLTGRYEVSACAMRNPDRDAPGDCVERKDNGRIAPARISLGDLDRLTAQESPLNSFCTRR